MVRERAEQNKKYALICSESHSLTEIRLSEWMNRWKSCRYDVGGQRGRTLTPPPPSNWEKMFAWCTFWNLHDGQESVSRTSWAIIKGVFAHLLDFALRRGISLVFKCRKVSFVLFSCFRKIIVLARDDAQEYSSIIFNTENYSFHSIITSVPFHTACDWYKERIFFLSEKSLNQLDSID